MDSSVRPRATRRTRPLALALVVVVALTACSGPAPDLAALESLDVANVQVPQAERVEVDRIEERSGSSFAKPRQAELWQIYRPADASVSVDEVMDALAVEVRAAGWELEDDAVDRYLRADREVDGRSVRLSLFVASEVDDNEVILRLVAF